MLRSEKSMGYARVLLAILFVGTTLGCVETSWREGREPMDYEPVSAGPSAPPSAGSVWNGGTAGGSFLFFDEKAASVGDLVTVVIVEQTSAEGDAMTETDSQRNTSASLSSQVGFQTLVTAPFRGLMKVFGFDGEGPDGNDGSEINVLQSGMNTGFAGEGRTSRSGTFTGVITCRVVGLLPNGILHIRGRRSVVVNHEAQYISLEGLVRREDLTIENQVMSNAIAEMRLAYDGMGVIDDKQRPGWMSRVLDWVYPF